MFLLSAPTKYDRDGFSEDILSPFSSLALSLPLSRVGRVCWPEGEGERGGGGEGGEEEGSLFIANAVNEEDSEGDRATHV